MPKLIITCGVSGSGKSTYASELVRQGWKEINRDWYRFQLYCNGERDWSKYKFTKERESEVSKQCEIDFSWARTFGINIIVSNTHLNQKDHTYWKTKAEESGYAFEVVYFPITLTEALKRDKKRGALSVGQDVLFDQWQKWLTITNAPKYVPNEFKPKAIILDIDGTVALTNGRGHFDYSDAVLTDLPRLDVIELVDAYANMQGAEIICVSGREDKCHDATQQWLDIHLIENTELFMRESGDSRCDTIVKEEIFWEHIEPYFNVVAAFDDRPKMIRKFKDIGIPLVVSVQKDYKEF